MVSLAKDSNAPQEDPIYSSLPLRGHLRETRVVYLEKGAWDDTISCRLEVVALGIKPKYEALSYVWGKLHEVRQIRLNGHAIDVGTHFWSALRHLRSTMDDRPLWADVICINQQDIEERNDQVALMRDIYSQSQGVIVWLGDANDWQHSRPTEQTSSCVWETDFAQTSTLHPNDQLKVTHFHSQVANYYRLPLALRQSLRIDHFAGAYCLLSQLAQNRHINQAEIPLLGNHDAFHKTVQALHGIMSRPWWTRQWVTQEVVLPPRATVYLGGFVAPWAMFARAARNYDRHTKHACCQGHYVHLRGNDVRDLEQFSRTVMELDDLREEWQEILGGGKEEAEEAEEDGDELDGEAGGGAGWKKRRVRRMRMISLRQLLWKFRNRETTDPRDRVFALFPLVNDWGKHVAIYPEYRWTAQEVYRVVVEKIVTMEESLLVLMGSAEKALPGLPSWVPDWTRKPERFELERLERAHLFRACGKARTVEVRFMDENVMELQGVMFDAVTTVSEIMRYDNDEETLKIFASWYDLACGGVSINSEYVAGGSRTEAYWRTLCMDTCRSLVGEEGSGLHDNGQRRRYKRCSARYVHDCMALWMDSKGLPRNGCLPANPELDNGDTARETSKPNGYSGSCEEDSSAESLMHYTTELTPSDQLNFVAVDSAIASATLQRRLFFTSKGYIGLGPPNTTEGDRVCVFTGGSMPFLVRDAGDREVRCVGLRACHQLIGDCYVHGVMDGEVMGNPVSGHEKEKVYLA
ncbi:hypothetical protein VTI74DRAFT_1378 [Chaetomium olivicolor]